MSAAMNEGRVFVPVMVLDELSRKGKDQEAWIKQHPACIVDLDEAIQREATAVLAQHQRLVMEKKQRFAADTFVIATAKIRHLTVVTEEGPANSMARPNIPDVCRVWDVPYMNLMGFIRTEGWVIGT